MTIKELREALNRPVFDQYEGADVKLVDFSLWPNAIRTADFIVENKAGTPTSVLFFTDSEVFNAFGKLQNRLPEHLKVFVK